MYGLWLYGRPGAGKTTLAEMIKDRMPYSVLLDADKVRATVNSDLGFSIKDRTENIRRVANISKLLIDQRHFPIVTAITPTTTLRLLVAQICPSMRLLYISCPLETCIKRDPKGMYAEAKRGIRPNFTGVGQVFEEPVTHFFVDTEKATVEECVDEILH